jgi:ribosome biogenesis protein SSF1/2
MTKARSKSEGDEDSAMTMVINLGHVGSSVKSLVSDLKVMLSPFSFAKLKSRSKNKLRDFTDVATPLGAKMLILLRSQLDKTTLAITKFPRGPTVYFNVLRYASMSDVHHGNPDSALVNRSTRTEPFLVLEGFTKSDQDETIVSMLQGLFPELHLGHCDLNAMKRVVIASKSEDDTVSLRHYRIQKRDIHVNPALRAIVDGKVPDLSDYESIDDYLMEGMQSHRKDAKPKSAVHLQEIGPRIDITFSQVETGVFGGMKLSQVEEREKPEKKFKYRSPRPPKPAKPTKGHV